MFETRAIGMLMALLLWLALTAGVVGAEEVATDAEPRPTASEDAAIDAELGTPTRAWDQPAVTALAQALAKEVTGVRTAFRNEPTPHIASGEARSRERLLDLLRLIESESRYLARQLEAGEGRDATAPILERLLEMIRKAQDYRARIFVQATALDAIEKARQPLSELSVYFGTALPEPRNIVR